MICYSYYSVYRKFFQEVCVKKYITIFRYLRVSTKSPLSWTGMPLARKSEIFGLYSIPANTTPVFLKTAKFCGFSPTRCFFDALVAEKTKMRLNAANYKNLSLSTV